jgi:hypothetical protein
MPFSLEEVVNDEELGNCFTIYRSSGHFGAGGWIEDSVTQITAFGTVAVGDEQAIKAFPEGDRITGAVVLFTETPIYPTLATQPPNGGPILADKILWLGQMYRVHAIQPWRNFCYSGALLQRMTGT